MYSCLHTVRMRHDFGQLHAMHIHDIGHRLKAGPTLLETRVIYTFQITYICHIITL